MNDNEREMDLALAEAEQENRLLRARNERLERELAGQVALDKMAENARELGLDYEPAPVQDLPFGVGGGLVAIKTLLGRDPCVHANTAIEMIDAILKEHPAAQPAVQEKCFLCGERVASCTSDVCPKSAQPAAQKGRDWSLLEATQESLREHMAEIKRLKAEQPAPVQEPVAEVKAKMTGGNVGIATVIHEIYSPHREPLQPGDKLYAGHRWMGWDIEQVWGERIFGIDMRFENVRDAIKFRAKLDEATPPAPQPAPVKTYHDGKPWPVAPKPWVGLTDEEAQWIYDNGRTPAGMMEMVEAKLKEKNT